MIHENSTQGGPFQQNHCDQRDSLNKTVHKGCGNGPGALAPARGGETRGAGNKRQSQIYHLKGTSPWKEENRGEVVGEKRLGRKDFEGGNSSQLPKGQEKRGGEKKREQGRGEILRGVFGRKGTTEETIRKGRKSVTA